MDEVSKTRDAGSRGRLAFLWPASARQRALLASALLVVLVAAIAALSIWRAQSNSGAWRALEQRSIAVAALEDMRSQWLLGATAMSAVVFAEDRTPLVAALGKAGSRVEEDRDIARFQLVALGDAEAVSLLDGFANDAEELESDAGAYLGRALDPESGSLVEDAQEYHAALWPESQAIIDGIEDLVDGQEAKLAAQRADADAATQRSLAIVVAFSMFALGSGIASLLWLSRSVVRPLASLKSRVRALASGGDAPPAAVSGPEEVASLARDFNEMVQARREAEDAWREADTRYRTLFDRSLEAVYLHDFQGRFLDANDAALRLLGYSKSEASTLVFGDLLDDAQMPQANAVLKEIRETGAQAHPTTFQLRRRDGSLVVVETNAAAVYEGDSPVAVQGVARDITSRIAAEEALSQAKEELEAKVRERTRELQDSNARLLNEIAERRRAEEAARQSEEQYRELIENISEIVYALDKEGRVTYVSPVVERLGGYAPAEVIGRSFTEFIHPEDLPALVESYKRTVSGNLEPSEFRMLTKSGEVKWIRTSSRPILESGQIVGLRAVLMDVTERRQAEDQIRFMAFHDTLTRLPNRALLKDRLVTALAQRHSDKPCLAVMYVDLDHIKVVNDSAGHAAGDDLLKLAAERIASAVREGDTVARLGGDEFTVMLPAIMGAGEACAVAERILKSMRQPWVLGGREFHVTASIGIAVSPQHGNDAETLLTRADTAMYRAKELGGDMYQGFDSDLDDYVRRKIALAAGLRQALRQSDLAVHYQPEVDIETGQITAIEALLRWDHPEQGLILPGTFIPVAEETGLIVPIGEWVLRTACAQNKAFQDAGLRSIRVAVNVSARQFQDEGLVDAVERALAETGLEPQYLQLEITEGTVMRDVESTINMLNELREMGVHAAIDDFGTGYSSLSYMRRLPINSVKIDESFVRDAPSEPDAVAIVAAILSLARNLNLVAVAEGVETEEQLSVLRDQGCAVAQGHLFCEAVRAETLGMVLAEQAPFGGSQWRRRASGDVA